MMEIQRKRIGSTEWIANINRTGNLYDTFYGTQYDWEKTIITKINMGLAMINFSNSLEGEIFRYPAIIYVGINTYNRLKKLEVQLDSIDSLELSYKLSNNEILIVGDRLHNKEYQIIVTNND